MERRRAFLALTLAACSHVFVACTAVDSSSPSASGSRVKELPELGIEDVSSETMTYVSLWVGTTTPTPCRGTVQYDDGTGWEEVATSGLFWEIAPGKYPGRGLVYIRLSDDLVALGDTVDFASMRLMADSSEIFSPFSARYVDSSARVSFSPEDRSLKIAADLTGSLDLSGNQMAVEANLSCGEGGADSGGEEHA